MQVETVVATTTAWTLSIAVDTALVGTNINAAYISYCTQAPTAVNDDAAPVASSNAAADPWTIYAPTCAGTQVNVPMTAVGVGASVPVANGVPAGTSVLFVSLLLSSGNAAATTTTPGALNLVAVE